MTTPQEGLREQLVASVEMLRAVQSSVQFARRANHFANWCVTMRRDFPYAAELYTAMEQRSRRRAIDHLNDARQWKDQAV